MFFLAAELAGQGLVLLVEEEHEHGVPPAPQEVRAEALCASVGDVSLLG